MREILFHVIYEEGETCWGASVPELPGVIAVAETREAVEVEIREAVAFHIEGLREAGLPEPAVKGLL